MEQDLPERRRIVVDGSNIATEGRTLPSLAQLDEAIRAFLEEYPGFKTSDVTVVVDASFGHRIDPSEVKAFDQAVEHGEMITPPAGAVGRGDGFILRIAEKSGALVLSNDSFQEFHAERPWLFEPGRLIGGKPVPGVGWIFTPRTPVRGARSRSVTAKSKRGSRSASAGSELTSNELADSSAPDGESSQASADVSTRTHEPTRSARAPKGDGAASSPKATKGNRSATATKAADATEASKTAKATKTAKASKTAKATKASKADSAAGTAKAGKVEKAAKLSKSTAAAGSTGSTGTTTKAAKSAKSTKAAKATKASKSTKAVKSTKAAKATKESKSAQATKASRAQAGPTPDAAPDGRDRASDNGSRGTGSAPEALNDPMTFLTFVADHPVGSTFDGTVVSFTSHGAHVDVGGMLCHVPLRGLADPPPKKARQVLTKGETREFELVSLDAARRRAELALPGIVA